MRIGTPALGNAALMAGLMQGMAQSGVRGQQYDMENKKLATEKEMAAARLALEAELGRGRLKGDDARLGLEKDRLGFDSAVADRRFSQEDRQFADRLGFDKEQFVKQDENTDLDRDQRGGQFKEEIGLRTRGQQFQEDDAKAGRSHSKEMQADMIAAQQALEKLASGNRITEKASGSLIDQQAEEVAYREGGPRDKADERSSKRAGEREQKARDDARAADATSMAVKQGDAMSARAQESADRRTQLAMQAAMQMAPMVADIMGKIVSDGSGIGKMFMDWSETKGGGRKDENAMREFAVTLLGYDKVMAQMIKMMGK